MYRERKTKIIQIFLLLKYISVTTSSVDLSICLQLSNNDFKTFFTNKTDSIKTGEN